MLLWIICFTNVIQCAIILVTHASKCLWLKKLYIMQQFIRQSYWSVIWRNQYFLIFLLTVQFQCCWKCYISNQTKNKKIWSWSKVYTLCFTFSYFNFISIWIISSGWWDFKRRNKRIYDGLLFKAKLKLSKLLIRLLWNF